MKSQQLEFFGCCKDAEVIFDALVKEIGAIEVCPSRGIRGEFEPWDISSAKAFIALDPSTVWYIFPATYRDRVIFRLIDKIQAVDAQNSPVVEYSPSYAVAQDLVKIGRLFLACDCPDFRRSIVRAMSAIRRIAVPLNPSGPWFLPDSLHMQRLRPWVGKDLVNPLYGRELEQS